MWILILEDAIDGLWSHAEESDDALFMHDKEVRERAALGYVRLGEW